jgi:phosphopantothenoylcysteine synthetase/decarboxylase
VVNEVGSTKGFGTDTNEVSILSSMTSNIVHAQGSKDDVAQSLIRLIAQQLKQN